jgi:hypothetical protein
MNSEAVKEILNELFSHLERLETQSEAILQFLKEKKRVTDKQLAPYLEQAGNASNVRWRAARVRIERLLSAEHPEKEIKLGKKPELHEDSSRAVSSDAWPSPADSSKDKRTASGDTGLHETGVHETGVHETGLHETGLHDKDKSAPADAIPARPTDGKADKPEEKPESGQGDKKQTAQAKPEQKPDAEEFNHPTEVTSPLAEQEGAEPATQLNSKEKNGEKEAA